MGRGKNVRLVVQIGAIRHVSLSQHNFKHIKKSATINPFLHGHCPIRPDFPERAKSCEQTWLLLHNCNSQCTLKLGPVCCKCCPRPPHWTLESHVTPVDRWQWKVRITSDPTLSSMWLLPAADCKQSYAMLIFLLLYLNVNEKEANVHPMIGIF